MGDNDVESVLAESPVIFTYTPQVATTVDSHRLHPIALAATATRIICKPNNSSILLNNSSLNSNLGSGGNYNCPSTGSPTRVYTLRQSVKLAESGNSSEQKANDEADSDFVLYRTASNNNKKTKRDCKNEEENEDFADGSISRNPIYRLTAKTTTATHKDIFDSMYDEHAE
uniref:Uncharacterized protein n=1 Tax=Glossina pallidipes TaxID=7398 RepID=A0A1A9Z4M4_GLOPL